MNNTTGRHAFAGDRLTPRAAIRAHCRECNGGGPKTCPVPTCPIFPFRMTVVPADTPTTPLRAIRARCLDCAGTSEAVRSCSAHKPFADTPACAIWPHRTGKRHVTTAYREARRSQANTQRRKSGSRGTFAPLGEAEE